MAIRNARPVTFRARGVSDTIDGTNAAAGMMTALSNLIPLPQTQDNWGPRAASTQLTAFAGFSTPARGEALFASGTRLYGFIQSARFAGHSEPFIYDTLAAAFITIAGVTAGNTPVSTANTGDWTPPTVDQIGAYVLFTHPGFTLPNAFGWLDMTGFTSATLTGNTHTSTTLDTLSTNVLLAGWQPGMTISSSAGDIPAGTRIVSIAAGGLSLVLSAAASGSNAGATLTVAGGTFAAPLWAAGNTNINPLAAVATAVAQYAGSACFAVNTVSPPSAAVVFSDAGNPLSQTNISQTVTFRNTLPVTALKGLPLNTLTGGIIQSLIAFQGAAAVQQLTGTPILNTLFVNTLNDATGTLAPNSVVSTPTGLLFAAPDGIRRIDFNANISPAIGRRGQGISTPFIFAVNPSRMAAAYNESVYRISVVNGAVVGTPTQEWWFHLDDNRWSGPHTFPATIIAATQIPHGFALFASGINAKLWSSSSQAATSATFVENGVQMTYDWQTSLLPDNQQMSENSLGETAIAIAIPAQQTAQFDFTNERGVVLGQVQLRGPPNPAALWGTAVWGLAVWGAGATYYQQQRLPWPAPIVFKQGQLSIIGNCAAGLQIGNVYMKYEPLGYMLLAG
jgi:hypothetical protein